MPAWLERWIYPIDKPDLDMLRFAHFLALATVTLRFVTRDWPGAKSPWLRPMILCGQHSLEIFCLGVFLAFGGYFVLTEMSAGLGLHFLVGMIGIVIMSAVAWMASWYKRSDARSCRRGASSATPTSRAGAEDVDGEGPGWGLAPTRRANHFAIFRTSSQAPFAKIF